MAMGNGTSIRNFDCSTVGSKGVSCDGGVLLPDDKSLTRVPGTPSADLETSSLEVARNEIT